MLCEAPITSVPLWNFKVSIVALLIDIKLTRFLISPPQKLLTCFEVTVINSFPNYFNFRDFFQFHLACFSRTMCHAITHFERNVFINSGLTCQLARKFPLTTKPRWFPLFFFFVHYLFEGKSAYIAWAQHKSIKCCHAVEIDLWYFKSCMMSEIQPPLCVQILIHNTQFMFNSTYLPFVLPRRLCKERETLITYEQRPGKITRQVNNNYFITDYKRSLRLFIFLARSKRCCIKQC